MELTEAIAHSSDSEWVTDPAILWTELHHLHLPMLAESGVLEYDPIRGLIRSTDSLERLRPTLELIIRGGQSHESRSGYR